MSTRSDRPADDMTGPPTLVTPSLLRDWPLPSPGEDKYSRGAVLVIGGARATPGAALLAGTAALRAGAGKLTLAVAESVAVQVGVALPECGAVGLPETSDGSVRADGLDRIARDLDKADVVLVGPGLDDPGLATELLRGLLERDVKDLEADVAEIARRFDAVVSCQGLSAGPPGPGSPGGHGFWKITTGYGGLGTSGSGDALAGAIAGLRARGTSGAQAACWGTHLHAAAADRLASRLGPMGFLARELADEVPALMLELGT